MNQSDIPKNLSNIKQYLLSLQHAICEAVAAEDEQEEFSLECWEQLGFGEGITRTISNGKVIEKGGVNFSHVHGSALPLSATQCRPELANTPYQVLGVSLVIHPTNPYVPTSHANVRFFVALPKDKKPVWWFGGGYDLTPYYGFEEDCIHWHQIAKNACVLLGEEAYPAFKKCCDEYFYLKHRKEPRGIGGLFFDNLCSPDFDTCFSFLRSVGNSYIEAYRPIVARRKNLPYGDREKQFQLYRRGRYVEFNLLYDRGTLFGLQSNGRTEAILMSMPPTANWIYDWHPEAQSLEAELYSKFLVQREW